MKEISEYEQNIFISRGINPKSIKKIRMVGKSMAIIESGGSVFAICAKDFPSTISNYQNSEATLGKRTDTLINIITNITAIIFSFFKNLFFKLKKAWDSFWS